MYNYKEEREKIFTEQGQKLFIKIRDKSKELLYISGAFRLDKVIEGCLGNSWVMLACIDYLVETKEIIEVNKDQEIAAQHRVFVKG